MAKVMGASHGDSTRVGAAAASYLFAVVSRPDVGGERGSHPTSPPSGV